MTIYFEWSEDLSVGEEVIDSQHKRLLTQINKILDAVTFGVDSKEVYDNMVPFLGAYIKEHFYYEEEYMKKMDYPNLNKYKKEHHNFIKNYIKFKKEFDNNVDKKKLINKIEIFMGTWWIKHIGKQDKDYHLFLKNYNKNNKQTLAKK